MGALDWTLVTTTTIAGVFSLVNTVAAVVLYRYMRIPSGGKLGAVMERTHANTSVTAAAIPDLLTAANGETHDTDEEAA